MMAQLAAYGTELKVVIGYVHPVVDRFSLKIILLRQIVLSFLANSGLLQIQMRLNIEDKSFQIVRAFL